MRARSSSQLCRIWLSTYRSPAGGWQGLEQVGQYRPLAAADVDDAPGGQRPEPGAGQLVHHDPGDQGHGPGEPGRLVRVLAVVLVDPAGPGRVHRVGTA